MREERIYKSLPLDDFMEHCSIVFAAMGVYLTPLVQNADQRRKMTPKKEAELKKQFMDKAAEKVHAHHKKAEVFDFGRFYVVAYEKSE